MDITTIIIVAIMLLVLAGVLVGLFFALRGGQDKQPAQNTGKARADLVEIARLERDKETNMLMVVVEGKLYANASNLSFSQRQRVASAASDLVRWLGLAPSVISTPPAAAYTPPPAAVQTLSEALPPEPVKPVSTNPLASLQRSISTSKPASFKSITAQIDEILQNKLLGTPLEKRGIHLAETPGGGVVVQVGLEQYPGIDAVSDDEVRNIIRSAVAEWEKRNR